MILALALFCAGIWIGFEWKALSTDALIDELERDAEELRDALTGGRE